MAEPHTFTKKEVKTAIESIDKKATYTDQQAQEHVIAVYKQFNVDLPHEDFIKQAFAEVDKTHIDPEYTGKQVRQAIKNLTKVRSNKSHKKKHDEHIDMKDKKENLGVIDKKDSHTIKNKLDKAHEIEKEKDDDKDEKKHADDKDEKKH